MFLDCNSYYLWPLAILPGSDGSCESNNTGVGASHWLGVLLPLPQRCGTRNPLQAPASPILYHEDCSWEISGKVQKYLKFMREGTQRWKNGFSHSQMGLRPGSLLMQSNHLRRAGILWISICFCSPSKKVPDVVSAVIASTAWHLCPAIYNSAPGPACSNICKTETQTWADNCCKIFYFFSLRMAKSPGRQAGPTLSQDNFR